MQNVSAASYPRHTEGNQAYKSHLAVDRRGELHCLEIAQGVAALPAWRQRVLDDGFETFLFLARPLLHLCINLRSARSTTQRPPTFLPGNRPWSIMYRT